MSRQLRKLIVPVWKIDTSDLTVYQGPASGISAEVLRPGCKFEGAQYGNLTGSGSGSGTIDTTNPGGLKTGDTLYAIEAGSLNTDVTWTVSSTPALNAGSTFDIAVTVAGGTYNVGPGDAFVLTGGVAGHRMSLYKDDQGITSLSNPITLSNDGLIEAYADSFMDADIKLSGSGVDTTYITDVPVEPRDISNVRDFGAKGDGSNDDTNAINIAIQYVSNRGGGKVFLPEGTYMVSSSIVMKDDVTLEGEGNSSIKVVGGTYANGFKVISFDAVDRAAVIGVIIDGNEGSVTVSSGSMNGIYLLESRYCRIQGCEFKNLNSTVASGGAAIHIGVEEADTNHSEHNWVLDNYIYDPSGYLDFGVRLWTSWYENQATSAYTNFTQNNVVRGNQIVGTGWAAIEVAGPATRHNTVEGNIVRGTIGPDGVQTDKGASYNTFVGNIVEGTVPTSSQNTAIFSDRGVEANSSGTHPERFAIGNKFVNCIARGAAQATGRAISAFYAHRSKRCGVVGLSVEGITAFSAETATYGFLFEQEVSDFTATGCSVEGLENGVFLEDGDFDKITFEGCNFNCDYRTIRTTYNASFTRGSLALIGCHIECLVASPGEYAVLLDDFAEVLISGCKIQNQEVETSTNFTGVVTVNGCVFGDSAGSGITVKGGAVIATGNVINDCVGYGIDIQAGSTGSVLLANNLDNNTAGAYSDSGTGTEIGHNYG